MSFKVRVDSSSPVLFCSLHAMIPRVISGCVDRASNPDRSHVRQAQYHNVSSARLIKSIRITLLKYNLLCKYFHRKLSRLVFALAFAMVSFDVWRQFMQIVPQKVIHVVPLADPGGRCGAPPPPPTGSISFVFTYVFAKKCMCQRLVPPPPTGRRPPPPPPNGKSWIRHRVP